MGVGRPETVERHLRRLGAAHVEGCGGEVEDHHMFRCGVRVCGCVVWGGGATWVVLVTGR